MSVNQKYHCPECEYRGLERSRTPGYTYYCPQCRREYFSFEIKDNVGVILVRC